MRLSRLKYFAFTNPGLERVLQRELRPIVGNCRVANVFGKRGIELRADASQVVDVFLKCRTIRSLRVQIGRPIHASNIRFLETNLERVNWTTFFDFKSHTYDFPSPVVRSDQSDLTSEKAIKQAFIDMVGKIFTFEDYEKPGQAQRRGTTGKPLINTPSLKEDEEYMHKLISGESTGLQQRVVAFQSPFYLNLFRNKLCLSLQVFNTDQLKTGLKPFVGWGSVQENVVAAFLIGTNLKEKFMRSREVRIFDPFCGSGTFLLESLLASLDWPIRTKEVNSLDLWKLNFVKGFKDELEVHTKAAVDPRSHRISLPDSDSPADPPKLKVSLIGADISKNQLSNAVLNFRTLHSQGVFDAVDSLDPEAMTALKLNAADANVTYFNFGEKALMLNADVGDFPVWPEDLTDFVLLTNIPFGKQSGDLPIEEIYRKFDSFLAKNHQNFSDIYVMNRANDQHEKNYFRRSRFGWEQTLAFSHGGIALGFYRFSLRKSHTPQEIVTVVSKRKRRGRSTKIDRTKYDPSKIDRLQPNSRKSRDALRIVRTTARNRFLERQKAYTESKVRAIRSRVQRIEAREAKKVIGEVKRTLGEQGFQEFQKRLK
jgi:23S rRNA G2445 N2-methylase RlmL